MSKHSEAFKLSVINEVLRGLSSSQTICDRLALDRTTVRSWVALYRLHGSAGIGKKFTSYSGAFKLSVLKHMWEGKMARRETAVFFNIRNPSCLLDWERRYLIGGVDALNPRRKGRPKAMPDRASPNTGRKGSEAVSDDTRPRAELLSELNYLRMENAYLKKLDALVQAKLALKKRK